MGDFLFRFQISMSKKMLQNLSGYCSSYANYFRFFSTKKDWKKLRPMILKRIAKRTKDYPVPDMVPVAEEVLNARKLLIQGVSNLLQAIPVVSCRFCPEVYIGEKGHLIQTCWGYKRGPHGIHKWTTGCLNDILVPVETFRLNNMFQGVIKHDQRFDFDRVPAVVELCRQAGVDPSTEDCYSDKSVFDSVLNVKDGYENLNFVGNETLMAWETVRSGVKKLLMVYPVKVCKYCSEVHVGPSGHKARLCGVFKYENWRGSHFWQKAELDDIVLPKIVWRQRPQDPPVLLDEGREFYGHAPAVVDLCTKAGAIAPTKYYKMMKIHGLPGPI